MALFTKGYKDPGEIQRTEPAVIAYDPKVGSPAATAASATVIGYTNELDKYLKSRLFSDTNRYFLFKGIMTGSIGTIFNSLALFSPTKHH